MTRTPAGFNAVRRIGLTLPDVEEGTAYGSPALKLHGRLLACIPTHKAAEPGSLVVAIDLDQRAALLEDDPTTYYVKPHYEPYPAVLVRLSRIRPDALRDLLGAAWKFVDAQHRKARKRTRKSR